MEIILQYLEIRHIYGQKINKTKKVTWERGQKSKRLSIIRGKTRE